MHINGLSFDFMGSCGDQSGTNKHLNIIGSSITTNEFMRDIYIYSEWDSKKLALVIWHTVALENDPVSSRIYRKKNGNAIGTFPK